MISSQKRMDRERNTIQEMTKLYCREVHHSSKDKVCPECQELIKYALVRLSRCPFQERKPTCAKCTVHCYNPKMREQTRIVMRYAGPRMLIRHPILSLLHLKDGLWKPPVLVPKKGK